MTYLHISNFLSYVVKKLLKSLAKFYPIFSLHYATLSVELPNFQFLMYAVASCMLYAFIYGWAMCLEWKNITFSWFLLLVYHVSVCYLHFFSRFLTILVNHLTLTLLHQMNFYWADQGDESQPWYDVLGGYCIIWCFDF